MTDDRDADGGIEYWQTVGQFQQDTEMRYLSSGSAGADYPTLSEGSHVARCYAVIDLGTQRKEFQGEVKLERQLRVIWEVPSERMTDGRPMAISKTYKASTHEKARFRIDIDAWRGKKMTEAEAKRFDITSLLGRAATIGVVHSTKGDRTYANVSSVIPVVKGTPIPEQENASLFFSLDEFDAEVYEKLPKGVREKIAKCPEYAEATGRSPVTVEDDDVPF